MKDFIRRMSPGWFTCVMGTGILSVVSGFYAAHFLQLFFFYTALTFFTVFFVFWIIRWLVFWKDALEDLMDPVVANFYPTSGVGALVLSAASIPLGFPRAFSVFFWVLGSVIVVFFSVLVPIIMFRRESLNTGYLNPAWFIPPVGLVVIPIAGSQLANSPFGVIFNLICLGSGMMLYFSLHAMVFQRLLFHHPLPPKMVPTLWINLGPIGAGGVALIKLTSVMAPDLVKVSSFGCAILWGLGIWWLVVSISLTLYELFSGNLDFAMSWWAFTFPLGAFISLSRALYGVFENTFFNLVGGGLYWLLVFIWIITFLRTLKALIFANPRP